MNDSTPKTWWKRLSGGLARTSSSLGGAIAGLVTKRKLDADTVEELEHELIRAHLGPEFAARRFSALPLARHLGTRPALGSSPVMLQYHPGQRSHPSFAPFRAAVTSARRLAAAA